MWFAVALGACGFFDTGNTPDPIEGIWGGRYPPTFSAMQDSAQWTFTGGGIYLLVSYRQDVYYDRTVGYYEASGRVLTLSEEPMGGGLVEELLYMVTDDDRLELTIQRGGGETLTHIRLGDADDAEEFRVPNP